MVIAEDEIVDRFQLKSVIVPVKIRTHWTERRSLLMGVYFFVPLLQETTEGDGQMNETNIDGTPTEGDHERRYVRDLLSSAALAQRSPQNRGHPVVALPQSALLSNHTGFLVDKTHWTLAELKNREKRLQDLA